MDDKLVTIRVFSDNTQAHIAQGLLEDNGVKCVLNNEIMSSVYPLTFTSIGGIKLLVNCDSVEIAEKILNTTNF
ncbi:MAG: DUF2007 domain-containing protein [Bacteroidales bacterium]|nr:DUF2007 domain-containing protein [Bacteroidales bacterium]